MKANRCSVAAPSLPLPPLMARRHISMVEDSLTYILKVKVTLRSAIRVVDMPLRNVQVLPPTLQKRPCSRFICLGLWEADGEKKPQQGTGLQGGVTQSICRATDTISAYINHISTARPPGACWGDSFMAHLQDATCQSAESDRYQRAATLHCHTDSSAGGGLFSKWKL